MQPMLMTMALGALAIAAGAPDAGAVLLGNSQYAAPEFLPEDNPDEDGGANNFRDRNTVTGGSITGDGNIGVNAAAGSFNQQSNLMTLAVATDSALAEANSGLIQTALFN